MKRQYLLFSLVVLSLAVVSSVLWLKLREERRIIEDLHMQTTAAASPIAAPLVEDRPAMDPQPPIIREAYACPPVATPVTMPTEEFVSRMEALLTQIPDSVTNILRDPELLSDPEYRKARLTQMRISESQNNPGLVETLELTDTEARNLFELMAAGQLDVMLDHSKSASGGVSLNSMVETATRVGVAHEQSVRALLGNEKYTKLIEYRAIERPAYVQAERINKILVLSGQPLAEAQSRALKAALLSEQRKPLQSQSIDSSRPVNIISISQARKSAKDSRMLEAAAPHLSALQLETLRRSFDSQASTGR